MAHAVGSRATFLAFLSLCVSCGPHAGKLVVERWTPIAEGNWTLEPGTENPKWCSTLVLENDVYISAIRPIAPVGTHHVTLDFGSDEASACTGALGPTTFYAATPNSGATRMPPDTAMLLPRGRRFSLSMHVYNSTVGGLHGVSGVEVVRVEGSTVKDEAGFVLAGPTDIRLPPRQRTMISRRCTILADQTIFALLPMMHTLGAHFKTAITQGAETIVLYDAPSLGEDQPQVPLEPIVVHAGDSVTTECTYDNDKYQWITSSHAGGEMCFSALLRSPISAAIDCGTTDQSF